MDLLSVAVQGVTALISTHGRRTVGMATPDSPIEVWVVHVHGDRFVCSSASIFAAVEAT